VSGVVAASARSSRRTREEHVDDGNETGVDHRKDLFKLYHPGQSGTSNAKTCCDETHDVVLVVDANEGDRGDLNDHVVDNPGYTVIVIRSSSVRVWRAASVKSFHPILIRVCALTSCKRWRSSFPSVGTSD
jgi:hypothetical protein